MAIDIAWSHLLLVNMKSAFWERTAGQEIDDAPWKPRWTLGGQGITSWRRVAAELSRRGYGRDICLHAEYSSIDVAGEDLSGDGVIPLPPGTSRMRARCSGECRAAVSVSRCSTAPASAHAPVPLSPQAGIEAVVSRGRDPLNEEILERSLVLPGHRTANFSGILVHGCQPIGHDLIPSVSMFRNRSSIARETATVSNRMELSRVNSRGSMSVFREER